MAIRLRGSERELQVEPALAEVDGQQAGAGGLSGHAAPRVGEGDDVVELLTNVCRDGGGGREPAPAEGGQERVGALVGIVGAEELGRPTLVPNQPSTRARQPTSW